VRIELIRLWLTVALAGALAWATLAEFASPPPTAGSSTSAAVLFRSKGCSGCHTIVGVAETGGAGPDLTHLARVAGQRVEGLSAVDYVRQSIRQPGAYVVERYRGGSVEMPILRLSESEVATLVEFLLEER
jgi:mono/diheme cytochrome c family protein